jgi:Family of unknown function (DUF6065)
VPLASLIGRGRQQPRIEFLCRPEDLGVVAEPVPARQVQPAWLKKLPGRDRAELSATNNALTVKRCVPFVDALGIGWILPLAATVRLEIRNEGRDVQAGWELDSEIVSSHNAFQAAGHPREPRPTFKFHNPWTIRTPAGWSCLFTPPLNRPSEVIEVFSGVVDTDRYPSPVNFPFVPIGDDGVHILPTGTPLVQVIPFARESVEADVRAETEDEADERERTHRGTLAGEGWYRGRSKER